MRKNKIKRDKTSSFEILVSVICSEPKAFITLLRKPHSIWFLKSFPDKAVLDGVT